MGIRSVDRSRVGDRLRRHLSRLGGAGDLRRDSISCSAHHCADQEDEADARAGMDGERDEVDGDSIRARARVDDCARRGRAEALPGRDPLARRIVLRSMTTVGRFAPSPTGPLHLGSLVAAVGSRWFAKRDGGRWLVRMEDLDAPRVVAGSAEEILAALQRYSLDWDGEVVYQSQRVALYESALDRLRAK